MSDTNPEIGLATKRFRAIDLSCRACGAGAGAKTSNSELGSPVEEPSVLLPQPPISVSTSVRLEELWSIGNFPDLAIQLWKVEGTWDALTGATGSSLACLGQMFTRLGF